MDEFLIFWIASSIGAIAIIPYQFKMLKGKIESEVLKNPNKKVPPTPVLMLISLIQSAVLLGIAAYVGTLLAPKVNLHWYLLDHWLDGTTIPYSLPTILVVSVVIGLLSALVILFLDTQFSKKMPKVDIDQPSRSQSLVASLYGGISEEVLTRLFIMTLVVYLSSLLGLEDISYWIGIIFAALLFGVLHLPAAFSIMGKSRIVTVRTILLNAIPGVLFGYLFWQYGIEIAMVSHFSADIFLHVIFGPIYRKYLEK